MFVSSMRNGIKFQLRFDPHPNVPDGEFICEDQSTQVYTQQSKTFDQPYEGTSHYVCIYDMRPRGYTFIVSLGKCYAISHELYKGCGGVES